MNLFKLKKDGKCVGYEETFFYPDGAYAIGHKKPNRAAFIKIIQVDPDGVAITNMRKFIIHDEKVPYVCDDKNGEKVFAGDRLKYKHIIIEVVWSEMYLRWNAKNYTDREYESLYVWNLKKKFEVVGNKWKDGDLLNDSEQ